MKRTDFLMFSSRLGCLLCLLLYVAIPVVTHAQSAFGSGNDSTANRKLFLDVHHFQPGSVHPSDVARAHAKDIAVQSRYGVRFLKYWVDEDNGLVYCLSAARDSSGIRKTHGEAHGLLPGEVYPVTEGMAAEDVKKGDYFLDIHTIGKVSAKAVEEAHQKDLKVQHRHGVHFLNYWVNEEAGLVFCLSKANSADSVIATHREAHGLLPDNILKVVQGE
ncbi:MAG: DUF4242 domain-containing protein [Agriterribacter sp.]